MIRSWLNTLQVEVLNEHSSHARFLPVTSVISVLRISRYTGRTQNRTPYLAPNDEWVYVLCLLNSPFSPARQLLSRQQGPEPELRPVLGWPGFDQPLQTSAGIRPLVITSGLTSRLPWQQSVLNAVCCTFRTGPDTVVLNASEPSKEKEKQGFFRAIKKKKKKSQMVT